MADLTTFKSEVTLIVNSLAKAMMTVIFTAAEKLSLNKQNPETEEKLSSLVDGMCVEAVDKILKMVELAAVKQEETPRDLKDPPGHLQDPPGHLQDPPGHLQDPPGHLQDPPGHLQDPPGHLQDPPGHLQDPPGHLQDPPGHLQDPPGHLQDPPGHLRESADVSKCLMKTTEGGGRGGERPPTGQTYILVYESNAVDSKCLLLPLQSHANANADANVYLFAGKNKTVSMDAPGEASSSPTPQADVPDHEYARPPSLLSRVSAARHRKQRCSRKKRGEPSRLQTATGEGWCQCSQCGMMFPNTERLSDHHRKSHPVCSVCGAVLTGIVMLREHVIQEHGLLPHACDYCPKRFNHKAHRDLHVKARHTGEKTCHCDICGKGYSCISMLKTHRLTHFEKTFTCDVCGKSFYHSGHLKRHKLVHQEVRPYQCSTCGKGFTQAENLRTHQAVHTGERQLCSICGKSFRFLKNHVISKHSHELPSDELPQRDAVITCNACGKKFPTPSQYKIHKRSHTGEKPFSCDVCGKSYRLKEQLRDHRYTHTGEKPYRCTLCSKTFNLATSFMRHRSIHTGETPYSCLDCGKHFRLLTFLKAHLQTKAHLKQTQQRQTAASDL
uniref:zinc finger protein 708-like isoform X1 n=2 Tax=Epinephelus lanceolatus TaxID=310571 RepID=UPI00144687DB|nr:zinc finger protein 708-like isoform X1 [Epinephelus lanceolatus]